MKDAMWNMMRFMLSIPQPKNCMARNQRANNGFMDPTIEQTTHPKRACTKNTHSITHGKQCIPDDIQAGINTIPPPMPILPTKSNVNQSN